MNKKMLERLRQLKSEALKKMEPLAKLTRELTAEEQSLFAGIEEDVKTFSAEIETLEAADKPTPAAGADAVDQVKLAADAATAERKRYTGIQAAFKAALAMCASLPVTLEKDLIDGGDTLDAARAKIFAAIEAEEAKKPTVAQQRAGVQTDERDKFRETMQAAILMRADSVCARDQKIVEMGREYAGLSLMEMAREYLAYAGVRTKGLSRDQVARAALLGDPQYFSGGMHSTSDFPNIVANVAKKTLRMGYEAAPRTFIAWARQVTTQDFKPINRIQLSDVQALRKVNEAGEYKRTTLSDSKETYALATYGDIFAITRRTIINDDLDALSRVPRALGQAAANMESDVVYAILTAGQTMTEDNVALFHANHSNLNTTNAFDDDGLAAARKNMRLQTAPKGTVLNLMLKFVLLPAALEHAADQYITALNLMPDQAANVIPNWMRSLGMVVESRLDAASGTTWYGAADPGAIDTVEYCYLEGEQGVTIETRQGFDVDGVEIKAREDFAAAAIDFRGLCKNTA